MTGILRVTASIVLALGASTVSAAPRLEQIPLVWKPTDVATIAPPVSGPGRTTIAIHPLMDRRSNPELIGENREDEPKVLPVTSRDEVGAWMTERLRTLMTQAGYAVVDGDQADLVLGGEVLQFFVRETALYEANVSMRLTLNDREGNLTWNGTGAASKKRFGRSYRAENYYEVLSDSTLGAVQELLAQPSFQSTLSQHANGQTGAQN